LLFPIAKGDALRRLLVQQPSLATLTTSNEIPIWDPAGKTNHHHATGPDGFHFPLARLVWMTRALEKASHSAGGCRFRNYGKERESGFGPGCVSDDFNQLARELVMTISDKMPESGVDVGH
jgi:hypothetical protein